MHAWAKVLTNEDEVCPNCVWICERFFKNLCYLDRLQIAVCSRNQSLPLSYPPSSPNPKYRNWSKRVRWDIVFMKVGLQLSLIQTYFLKTSTNVCSFSIFTLDRKHFLVVKNCQIKCFAFRNLDVANVTSFLVNICNDKLNVPKMNKSRKTKSVAHII